MTTCAELRYETEDLDHHERRQAERRLVEHYEARLRHQAAGNGEHLLLAAVRAPSSGRTSRRKTRLHLPASA
jgi:hypothetical protein